MWLQFFIGDTQCVTFWTLFQRIFVDFSVNSVWHRGICEWVKFKWKIYQKQLTTTKKERKKDGENPLKWNFEGHNEFLLPHSDAFSAIETNEMNLYWEHKLKIEKSRKTLEKWIRECKSQMRNIQWRGVVVNRTIWTKVDKIHFWINYRETNLESCAHSSCVMHFAFSKCLFRFHRAQSSAVQTRKIKITMKIFAETN